MPKISIITPVWCDISQKVDWLDEMIQSVQRQTLTDWELILINDKSPLSLDPVRMKHAADSRLRWLENAANVGPARTRNTAVALAQADCILPLDSDDMLGDEETLEIMYDIWLIDKTKIIYGNLQTYRQISPNVFRRDKVYSLGEYSFEMAMNLGGLMPVTCMHSKECHYEAGGWKAELGAGLEDLEYWIAAGKRGYCGQKISHTTLVYRRQEESRAYKMKHVNRQFEVMQQKIKAMHNDIYSGRFPVACCGKGGSSAKAIIDPVAISQQAQGATVRIVTPLEGYEEKDLEWVAYRGPKKARSGSIIPRGPNNTPVEYPILGSGHVFQIHKAHRKLFEDRQRLGFVMNEPDPRQREEEQPPEPISEPAPQVIEVPPPELSTIVRPDAIAAQTREVSIQSPPAPEVIIEPHPERNYSDTIRYSTSQWGIQDLNLSDALTETLLENNWSVETIATATPKKLSSLPGIGIKRAKTIIDKAQELIKQT